MSSVKIALKACKELADFFRLAQISHGLGDGVLIAEPQQRGGLLLTQLLNAAAHVVLQHEIETQLLPAAAAGVDGEAGLPGAALAGVGGSA